MVQLICALMVGGLLWQLAIFTVFLLVNGDERTTVLYSMGVFTGAIYLWYLMVNKYRLMRDRSKYNCYWFYADGKHYPVVHAYMTKEYAKQFETNSKADNYIELIQYGCDFDKPIDKAHLLDDSHLPIGMTLEDISKFYKK